MTTISINTAIKLLRDDHVEDYTVISRHVDDQDHTLILRDKAGVDYVAEFNLVTTSIDWLIDLKVTSAPTTEEV